MTQANGAVLAVQCAHILEVDRVTNANGAFNGGDSLSERSNLTHFLMPYQCGLDEVMTKVNILRRELTYAHEYNPIEHVESRLKSADSILNKARRLDCGTSLDDIRQNVFDIAGIRVVCSFTTDVYEVCDMLASQADLTLLRTRDYIATPKPNGYRSLHLLLRVPVFLSDRVEPVCVEVQVRTVAMDFWASIEHKAIYKYRGEVPTHVREELQQAASIARSLDSRIENLRPDIVQTRG